MAGLPQNPALPGVPLIDPLAVGAPVVPIAPQPPLGPMVPQLPDVDPLTGMPVAPEPQGYQYDAAGLPYPPDEWFAEPAEPLPQYQGASDIPVIEPAPPTPAPPATAEAGAAGMAALDQARTDGHLIDPYPPETPAKPGPPRDPYLEMLDETGDIRSRALVQQVEAEKAKNEYLATEGTRIAQDNATRQAAADNEYQQIYNEARASRKALDQEAQDIASTKIDPKRAWNKMDFAEQLTYAITAFLVGGTSQSMKTGRNSVVDMVHGMAERDIQAQQADLENRRAGLATRRGLLADDMAAGRDMLDVRYRSLNAAYDMAANGMKSYAMKFDNPVIDARTAVGLADIQERKVQLGTQYEQAKQQQLYERKKDAQQQAVAWYNAKTSRMNVEDEIANRNAPKPPTIREVVALSGEERAIEQDQAARRVHLARRKDGSEVRGPTKEVTAEINSDMATVTTLDQKLDRLEQLYADNGWSPMGAWGTAGEGMKEATAIQEEVLADFSKMKEQGVIRDGEYARYERMLGKPGGFLDPRTNLKTMRRSATQGMNNKLQARIGPDVAYWTPATTAENKTYFGADEDPKKQPAPAGLPALDGKPQMTPQMSPAEKRFIETGRYTPEAPSAEDLLEYDEGR